MAPSIRAAVPSFFTVTVWMFLAPIATVPKGNDSGVTVISGTATAPLAVPLRLSFAGASSGSFEGTLSLADLTPGVFGLNRTSTVQD